MGISAKVESLKHIKHRVSQAIRCMELLIISNVGENIGARIDYVVQKQCKCTKQMKF